MAILWRTLLHHPRETLVLWLLSSSVIMISHPIKHWSLLQLTENIASLTLSFQCYILWVNQYRYSEIPWLLRTVPAWFIPRSNMSWQAQRLLSNCALCTGMWSRARCKWNANNLIFSALVVTDEGKCMKSRPDQSPERQHNQPHAAFVPLSLEPESSTETFSLQVSSELFF